MSVTYSIGCKDCECHVWIGQSLRVYGGNYRTAIAAFLHMHVGHHLVFDEHCESPMAEWEEIEVDEKDGSLYKYQGKTRVYL